MSSLEFLGPRSWLATAQGVPSTLAPAGAGAHSIAGLTWYLIVVAGLTCLVVTAILLYATLRRRGNLHHHEPPGREADGGAMWIHVGGIAVPVLILAVTFIVGLRALGAFPVVRELPAASSSTGMPALDSGEIVIDVTGQQWWWQIRYRSRDSSDEFETANQLHIPVGRPVRINLMSRDVNHSFWIPQLHPKMDLIPGEKNTIVLRADVPGEYRGECAEFCGLQHANMAFIVVAEPDDAFRRWLAHERQPAAAPSDSMVAKGLGLFYQQACSHCHTVRGSAAEGRDAPDLTHVAGRSRIAGGLLANNRANLEAWVLDAPALKPGTRMPRMTNFDGPGIHAMISYLESLR